MQYRRYGPKCFRPIRVQIFEINYVFQKYEMAECFKHRYKIIKGKSWLKKLLLDIVKNGFGHSSDKSLAGSQGCIVEINWFFACWYKFRKANSYFNDLWVGLVKNKCLFSFRDSKICCILIMNSKIELIVWFNSFLSLKPICRKRYLEKFVLLPLYDSQLSVVGSEAAWYFFYRS